MAVFPLWMGVWILSIILVHSWRLEPTNPFPPPILVKDEKHLQNVFIELEEAIREASSGDSILWDTNNTSFSIALTSASETLLTTSYTAANLGNYSNDRLGRMDDQTYFRIASISKVFTVLAVLLQEKAGNCSLRDPITRYVPELKDSAGPSTIKWGSITLETLASQLSGLPREYGQSDLTDPVTDQDYGFEKPIDIGLPPLDPSDVPQCGRNRPGERPCSKKEIIDGIVQRTPLFAPNHKGTYSNMAFVMLGFALENMTGAQYAENLQSTIFDPLGMHRASLTKPADKEGIIPKGANDWNADIGTYGPTGGIYTTAADLALFVRSILTNKQLDEATTNAWFHPRSYSSSWCFAYGMPWEIFRTSDMLADSDRIQTVFLKTGALRGYSSQLLIIPEYDLGIVVFVAGDSRALPWLREEVLRTVVPAVEQVARDQAADRIAGSYISRDTAINSSLSIGVKGGYSLVLTSWISNGTDFLAEYTALSSKKNESGQVQLTPSMIGRGKNSEVWRAGFVRDKQSSEGIVNTNLIEDVDTSTYASRSLDEFVFELDASGHAVKLELPALRITLKRQQEAESIRSRPHQLMKALGFHNV
ncbi:MAG: hypothetical protein Q9186_000131 [Xanthomendoza sp. 1 TL-2023]